MPDKPGIRQNGFFQKIIASANAGMPAEPLKTGVLGSLENFPSPSYQMDLNRDPFIQSDSAAKDRDLASNFNDPWWSEEADGKSKKSWCGEEGPLSGAAPGLNERVDHFGVSAFSWSDPEAVGSASKSSRDTHVKGIGHAEVSHASGHLVSSSTVSIESGVSKTSESNQALFNGSKVVRYADAKDWRQQAVLSEGHGERGQGQSGQDDDRAGLPPPSLFQNDRADGLAVSGKDILDIALEAELSEKMPADDSAKRAMSVEFHHHLMSAEHSGDTSVTGHDDMSKPEFASRNNQADVDAERNAHGTGNSGDKGQQTHVGNQSKPSYFNHIRYSPITEKYEQGSTAGGTSQKNNNEGNLVVPVNIAGSGGAKREQVSSFASRAMIAPAEGKTPAPVHNTALENNKKPDSTKMAQGVISPDKPGADFYISPSAGQLQNRFAGQDQQRAVRQPREPQVEIGHIDVIVETPQASVNTGQESSRNASGMASRYYLKGL